ncbi:hypothetical protein PPYR_05612 [Photinus pyralis]|uniref:DDE-1 domain-containing protein n=1 Tax=Photinus pyralis TaxID=7054 RepID=A0A5N4AVK1_PHOPY|nr:uncharacterized protein LOC116165613 [Photinus pyralis]KAB0801258.1 hypothetical protein PPYR_05612 [Photinus pyralis]
MPFKYKKRTDRVPPAKDVMEKAVKEVAVEGCKLRTTATKYGMDKMTLRRYVLKYKEHGMQTTFLPNFKKSQIFADREESALAQYLLTASKMNYGLTPKECRKLAYLYAIENGKNVPRYWTSNEEASYDWFRGFMERNGTLSIRRPEPTSLSRATAFNRHTVSQFFQLLRKVLERDRFEAAAIYNCDETGVQTAHKPGSIISQKGLKQVSKATSAERGQTVTICCAVNAVGNFIPPFFVFPRVKKQDYMTYGAPVGSVAATHPSGWMTVENFLLYLEHFKKYVKCSIENKVLLILDNHSTHISPQGLKFCKNNGIVLLTLPPHTSHRIQPLDVASHVWSL